MLIVIAGGSGFLGRALTRALKSDQHRVVVLTRRGGDGRDTLTWTPDGQAGSWARAIDGADAVINLAGDSIGEGRWTADKKRRILDSRVLATRSLVTAIAGAAAPPAAFISGSAVGYYGALGDEIVTEEHPAGSDFLAGVCARWEEEAVRALSSRTRVTCIRTGLVLAKDGGALPRMLMPFRFGVGGPLGSGRQYMPWIHKQDWVDLVRFVLGRTDAPRTVNATAPTPVTNAEFTKVLGRALHRPAFLPAPAFALRLLLGEMADALLLSGQRAVPAQAERLGFGFSFARAEAALAAALR